jgi:hypothetical protein
MAAPAAVVLSGLPAAYGDVLIMEDGRRIRGELVMVNRGVVTFDEDRGASTRSRRMRVRVEDVNRINFTDQDDFINDDDYYPGSDYGVGNNSRWVTVRADQRWIDTGLNVRAGDSFRFEADGVVLWGPGRQDGPAGESGSPYNANRPLPNRPAAALVGRIGNSGDVFFVGSDTGVFRARTSGRLYLGVNDDYLNDNSGAFRVRVLY